MSRSQFVTKTGVIAATVGSAVGLGNIWRFPYEAGTHGGGAFLLIYIFCVLVVGVPVMISEFVVGRHAQSSAVGAFRKIAPRSPFRAVATTGIIASLMILSFYSVVAGWIMEYLFQSVVDLFVSQTPQEYADRFLRFISNPWRPVMWTVIFLCLNLMVIRRGVEKGVEKASNIMMPCLFLLLVIFCVNSMLMPKAAEGADFLLHPDFSQITPSVVIGAMGQAFFTLSIGLTCMLTYASYFSPHTNLARSALVTALLDTVVAVISGLIIFPAVFTYGMSPEAGPRLVFEIFPSIFAQMPGGKLWAVAFFLLLFFASLTSTISMSEISISYFMEERKLTRRGASALNTGICMFFGVLCALSFGPLASLKIFGMTLFDLFDYVSSNILLPCGGIMFSLFVGWVLDKEILRRQLSDPKGRAPIFLRPLRWCLRWVAPAAIAIILVYGLFR